MSEMRRVYSYKSASAVVDFESQSFMAQDVHGLVPGRPVAEIVSLRSTEQCRGHATSCEETDEVFCSRNCVDRDMGFSRPSSPIRSGRYPWGAEDEQKKTLDDKGKIELLLKKAGPISANGWMVEPLEDGSGEVDLTLCDFLDRDSPLELATMRFTPEKLQELWKAMVSTQ